MLVKVITAACLEITHLKSKPHPPEDTELMLKIHVVYNIKDAHCLRCICHLGVGWNQFKSFQHIFVILLWADINSKVNKQGSLVFRQLTQISCRPNNCEMYYYSGIPLFNPWVTTSMLTSALSSFSSMMAKFNPCMYVCLYIYIWVGYFLCCDCRYSDIW